MNPWQCPRQVRRAGSARLRYLALVLALLLVVACAGGGTEVLPGSSASSDHFTVYVPTPEEEAAYVAELIRLAGTFAQFGYAPALPDHPIVKALYREEAGRVLTSQQMDTLAQLFVDELYRAKAYARAHHKVTEALPRIESVYAIFHKYQNAWGFAVFDRYQIQLTLYGPGGMFDPDRGIIWLMIEDGDSFKMNPDPSYAIVHEATHIGFDEPIVRRYGLSQPTGERLVDRFLLDHFAQLLPDYQLQGHGDSRIDPYLAHPDAWERLPHYVAQYAREQGSER